jgi:hypothetical protein
MYTNNVRLSDLSEGLRVILKWVLLGLAILFLLWLSWTIINGITRLVFKPKLEDVAYGKIAPPLFTKTLYSLKANRFRLSADLPKDQKAEVYKAAETKKFSTNQRDNIANFFGLSGGKKSSSENVVSWEAKGEVAKLSINYSVNNIIYRFNYSKDTSPLSGSISLGEKDISEKTQKILKSLNLLPKDIDVKNPSVNFISIKKGVKKTSTQRNANVAEISYFRKVGKKLSSGHPPIRIMLSKNGNKVLELDYFYLPLGSAGSSYPIISASQAWKTLQAGKAFVEKSTKFTSVKITNVKLSYWESKFHQSYLQPIWVFSFEGLSKKGREKLKAYLPAIDPSFLTSGN